MANALFKPGQAMQGLIGARHPARRALLRLGGVGVLYTAAAAILGFTGAVPTAPVCAGIAPDNYYFWQMIFILPGILAAWLVSAGSMRLLGRRESGGPGFGATAALAGLALGWPLVLAWVPSAVEAAFLALGMGQGEWVGILSRPGPWQTAYLAVYAAAAALVLRNFILAARILRKRSWLAALLAGIFAAAVVLAAFVVFVR